jgi:hypothetical protein
MYKSGSPIQTAGQNLVGLWRPSFTRVDNKLYIFGGGGQVTTDLHALDLADMRWSTVQVLFFLCGTFFPYLPWGSSYPSLTFSFPLKYEPPQSH